MKFWILLAGTALLSLGAQAAEVQMKNAEGKDLGKLSLQKTAKGVRISGKLSGLPPGQKAIHIHAVGKCEPPDFTSAGPHFNPEKKQHGLENPQGHHAGDLPNITVASDGTVQIDITATGVGLGKGGHSLFQPGGTAVVVHAGADDMVSDPAGNAGARIACGVVK